MAELFLPPLLSRPSLALPHDPSLVIVSISGGKDSIAALLKTLAVFGQDRVVAHHQVILEDWMGTPAYCQSVCEQLGVPLYKSQGRYNAFLCRACGHHHLSIFFEEAYCHRCGSYDKEFLSVVDGIHSLIRFRRKWVDARVRACTGHFKIEVWNQWARANEDLLGKRPILVLGERRQESRGRAELPELRYRDLRKNWVLEWRPVLGYRRIDAYRALREAGIEPHYCYRLQWCGLLRRQHQRWRQDGVPPRISYPGQWDGLDHMETLSDQILDHMIERLMYEVDESCAGPRCSCRDCFFKSPEEMQATYDIPQGKHLLDESIALEREIGFTMKHHLPLQRVLQVSQNGQRNPQENKP